MTTNLVRLDHYLVFVERELSGCPHPFEPEIQLDESTPDDSIGGTPFADPCVGIDPADCHHYRIFPSTPYRTRAGYHQVIGIPIVVTTWRDFVQTASECGELIF